MKSLIIKNLFEFIILIFNKKVSGLLVGDITENQCTLEVHFFYLKETVNGTIN